MEPDRWARLEQLYGELLPLDEAARRLRLASLEKALADELESLLAHDDPDAAEAKLLELDPNRTGPRRAIVDDERSTTIGPYRIVRKLGSGGMGTVYLAEQLQPVRRTVALKVIKSGMDTDQVLRRFAVEKHTLGRMDHPGIARILEAGESDQGRPFFALEYVDGTPILDWCDAHRLGTRSRILLFIQVCRALQHAHDRSVVHRDVKPTNILVTTVDGNAVPKLIDFGIARSSERDATAFTQDGQIVGTPEYMSPEQMRLDPAAIDSRSDIYSAGLVLYELLTGDLPFDRRSLVRMGPIELQELIAEREAPRPSSRLSSSSADIATRRGTTLAVLRHQLRGDLDWIVLRALEKDPKRRYRSAADLADDLERHLRFEPVSATPPSRTYVLRKFIRRHRIAVSAGVALALSLIVGLVTSLVLYRQAQQRYEELLRLSDSRRIERLRERADELWPTSPTLIPKLETWLRDADELLSRRASHAASLARLREFAIVKDDDAIAEDRLEFPGRQRLADARSRLDELRKGLDDPSLSALRRELNQELIVGLEATVAELGSAERSFRKWEFRSGDLDWQHGILERLVGDLDDFVDPEFESQSNLPAMRERLELARRYRDHRFDGYDVAWRRAREALPAVPAYVGLAVEEQFDLLPLGPDPQSGLWEFAVLGTGKPPQRGSDGKLVVGTESSIVLVLLPGGRYRRGAERLEIGGEWNDELELLIADPGSFGEKLGLRVGDRVVRVGEVAPKDAAEWHDLVARCATGDRFHVDLLRQGQAISLVATVPGNVDPYARGDERPVHDVTIAPLLMSKYEISQAQWYRMTLERPSDYGPDTLFAGKRSTLLHPVAGLTWEQARRGLRRYGLDAPSEAEWEYACRAGTTTVWPSGNRIEGLQGAVNVLDRSARDAGGRFHAFTLAITDGRLIDAPVTDYAPNPWGLHNMLGNVWEWCIDPFEDYPGPAEPDRQDTSELRRVIRGGAWANPAIECRPAARSLGEENMRSSDFGVRAARPWPRPRR